MRPGSLFLNLSRGFVVDYGALRDQVLAGHIAGAAVDVFPAEPRETGEAFRSELQGLPNVILTPHVGGSTEEAQADIGRFVAGKLRDYHATGQTALSVNLPALVAEPRPGTCRITHIHHNTPGVMATANKIMADHKINIEAQHLSTRGALGYVITDVACDPYGPAAAELSSELRAMAETIRVRVLP
jgi:D-3-phosphoglycerate dehydrogenase